MTPQSDARTLNRYREALHTALGDYLTARVHTAHPDTLTGTVTTVLRDHNGPVATVTAHARPQARVRLTVTRRGITDTLPADRPTNAAHVAANMLRAAWENRP